MSALSPALAGAIAGLGLGLIEYRLITRLIAASLARTRASEADLPGAHVVEARLRPIRYAVGAASFALLPAIGYAVGAATGP